MLAGNCTSEHTAFRKTISCAQLPEGGQAVVELGEHSILLCRVEGRVLAVQNQCTHAGSRLASGSIIQGSIRCPLHGVRFDLLTGRCLNLRLNCAALRCYPAREVDGFVEISLDTPEQTNEGA